MILKPKCICACRACGDLPRSSNRRLLPYPKGKSPPYEGIGMKLLIAALFIVAVAADGYKKCKKKGKVVHVAKGWKARTACYKGAKCAVVKCGRTIYRSSSSIKPEGEGRMMVDTCDFDFVHYIRTVKHFFHYRDGSLCYPTSKKCPNGFYPTLIAFLDECDDDDDDRYDDDDDVDPDEDVCEDDDDDDDDGRHHKTHLEGWREPTKKPTYKPTLRPTSWPTKKPTARPTTPKPTPWPTRKPTSKPTKKPTNPPTPWPTRKPTSKPTKKPTTAWPTKSPFTPICTDFKCLDQKTKYSHPPASESCGPPGTIAAAAKCGQKCFVSDPGLLPKDGSNPLNECDDCDLGYCRWIRVAPKFFDQKENTVCFPLDDCGNGKICPNHRRVKKVSYFGCNDTTDAPTLFPTNLAPPTPFPFTAITDGPTVGPTQTPSTNPTTANPSVTPTISPSTDNPVPASEGCPPGLKTMIGFDTLQNPTMEYNWCTSFCCEQFDGSCLDTDPTNNPGIGCCTGPFTTVFDDFGSTLPAGTTGPGVFYQPCDLPSVSGCPPGQFCKTVTIRERELRARLDSLVCSVLSPSCTTIRISDRGGSKLCSSCNPELTTIAPSSASPTAFGATASPTAAAQLTFDACVNMRVL
ncbi:hypothetical protein AAMO2058_000681100 [Amorphochlora amoebiformis]